MKNIRSNILTRKTLEDALLSQNIVHEHEQYKHSLQEQFLPVLSILQLTLFGLLGWWVHRHPLLPVDVTITRKLQRNQSPILRYGMIILSLLNEHHFLNVLTIPIAVIFWRRRLRLEAVMMVGSTILSNVFRKLFHNIVNRPRPHPPLVKVIQQASNNQSFPSGHVLGSVLFWGWLIAFRRFLLAKRDKHQKALLSIPALFLTLIGPSRVYLGDHWTTDVVGGYLLGSGWLALCISLYYALKRAMSRADRS
ncbi:MAG TPA: phosphatase PAP2 family protein [Ktedonobacteraceae bacterium]|nr:phosphatase PAP2 family protein [Ktedonobacteraceae bacterium]